MNRTTDYFEQDGNEIAKKAGEPSAERAKARPVAAGPDDAGSDSANAHHRRGIASAARADHPDAIAEFTAALHLHFDDAVKSFEGAVERSTRGEAESAASAMAQVAQAKLRLAEAYLRRGVALSAHGEIDRAIADFDQVVRLGPARSVVYLHRGEAHRNRGDIAEAIDDFATAVRLDPAFMAGHFYGARSRCAPGHDGWVAAGHVAVVPAPVTIAEPKDSPRLAVSPSAPIHIDVANQPPVAADVLAAIVNLPCAEKETPPHVEFPEVLAPSVQRARAKPVSAPARPLSVESVPEPASPIKPIPPAVWKPEYVCPSCADAPALIWDREARSLHCTACNSWFHRDAEGSLVPVAAPAAREPRRANGESTRRGTSQGIKKFMRPRPRRTLAGIPSPPLRWVACGVGVLAMMLVVLSLVENSRAGSLAGRGEEAAKAWLAQDEERLETFIDPASKPALASWLVLNPPPSFAIGATHSPSITGAVEHNDGQTADVRVLIELKDANDVNHVFTVYQRWGAVEGTWYFAPKIDRSANLAGGASRARARR